MARTKVTTQQGDVVHDAATLARDYGYRELREALRVLDNGPPGFDLNRNPLTKDKADFARYIVLKHGGAAITTLLPLRGEGPTVATEGEAQGGGEGESLANGSGSNGGGKDSAEGESGNSEADSQGDGDGDEEGEGEGHGFGDGDGDGEGEGEGEEESEGDGEGSEGEGDGEGQKEGKGEGSESDKGQKGKGEQEGDGGSESEADEHPLVAEVRRVVRSEVERGNIVSPEAVQQAVQDVVKEALKDVAKATEYKAPKALKVIRLNGQYQHPAFEEVMDNVVAGNNVLLVGPAGCGKTTLGRSVAKAWRNTDFHRLPYTAGASEAWIIGRLLPTGENGRFEYHVSRVLEIHTKGGVVLHDEMDAGDPNMLLINNGLTDDGDFINPLTNQHHPKHVDAAHLGAVNTWGWGGDVVYCGRNALDAATNDRWYPIPVDYDPALEARLARKQVVDFVWGVREAIKAKRIPKVISTRACIKAERALAVGRPWTEVRTRLLGGWTADEQAKVAAFVKAA